MTATVSLRTRGGRQQAGKSALSSPYHHHHGLRAFHQLQGKISLPEPPRKALRRDRGQHRTGVCHHKGARQDGGDGHPGVPQRREGATGDRQDESGSTREARQRGRGPSRGADRRGRAGGGPGPGVPAVRSRLRPEVQGLGHQGRRPHQQRRDHGHPRAARDRGWPRNADRRQPLRRAPADEADGAFHQRRREGHLPLVPGAQAAPRPGQGHPGLRQRQLREAGHVQQLDGLRAVQARQHPGRQGVRQAPGGPGHQHLRVPPGHREHGAHAEHDGLEPDVSRDPADRTPVEIRPGYPSHRSADHHPVRGGPVPGRPRVLGQVLGRHEGGDALEAGAGSRQPATVVGDHGVRAGGEARQEGGRPSPDVLISDGQASLSVCVFVPVSWFWLSASCAAAPPRR